MNEEDLTPFLFAGPWFRFGEDEMHRLAEADPTGRAGAPDPGPSGAFGLVSHVALEVEDLEAALARLEEDGVPLIGRPMPRGDGVTQVFLRDPDGYVLELFQWTGEDQSDAPECAPIRG
jgi:catechol 2,3-dioxygenase-like lactoylglutathione lyase family enzyme